MKSVLSSSNGSKFIVAFVDCRDAIFSIYAGFSAISTALRSDKERLKTFKARFEAAVNCFRSDGVDNVLSDPSVALLLLTGSLITNSQRAGSLAACMTSMPVKVYLFSQKLYTKVSTTSFGMIAERRLSHIQWSPLSTPYISKHIKYSSIDFVLRPSGSLLQQSR